MGEERDGVYVVVLPQKATRADRRTRIASMAFFLFFLGSPGYSDLVVRREGALNLFLLFQIYSSSYV